MIMKTKAMLTAALILLCSVSMWGQPLGTFPTVMEQEMAISKYQNKQIEYDFYNVFRLLGKKYVPSLKMKHVLSRKNCCTEI